MQRDDSPLFNIVEVINKTTGRVNASWQFNLVNDGDCNGYPPGKRSHNYGKSPFSMGKSTISMAMFNSYVTNY